MNYQEFTEYVIAIEHLEPKPSLETLVRIAKDVHEKQTLSCSSCGRRGEHVPGTEECLINQEKNKFCEHGVAINLTGETFTCYLCEPHMFRLDL